MRLVKLLTVMLLAICGTSALNGDNGRMVLDMMVGTWDVRSRMWMGPGEKPVEQPPATAVRMVPAGGGFMRETISGGASDAPFTREATLNLNVSDGVYEYASMDTRAPQLMHYRSAKVARIPSKLDLRGGEFTVAEWGKWRNARFSYHIELDGIDQRKHAMRIFFRPIEPAAPEFLATQYDYTKR